MDAELDQLVTESNAQDVRLDTSEAAGHVSTADLADDAVTPAKTAFIDDTLVATDTHIMVADGTDFDNVAVSGDATLANTGALTIANDAVTTVKVLDLNVTTGKLANDAVTAAKTGYIDDSLAATDTHIMVADGTDFGNVAVSGDATLSNAGVLSIGSDKIVTAKILNSNVTLPKIVDASATNKVLGRVASGSGNWEEVTLETTLSSTDEAIPTSKAVRDDIVSLVNDVGGFHAIADDQSFPNTNPDPDDGAGTVVSISNAGGLVINGSGTSTTGRTLGGSTVTITGIPSTYYSLTLADSLGMQVISTVTLNTYTYHKITAKEGDTNIVATDIANVNLTGGSIANVNLTGGSIANVNLTGANITSVNSVAAIVSDVTAVAADASDIGVVAADGTDIGVVAGQTTEIGRLGTSAAVADMALLGIAAVITDMDLLGASGVIDDMETVSNAIANVNLTGGSIANVNTVGAAIADVNRYAEEYTIGGSAPGSPDEGDLWYDEVSDLLNVYSAASWSPVSSATSGITDLHQDASPQLGANLDTLAYTISNVSLTLGGVFSNPNTITANTTFTTAALKNMFMMGQISVNDTYTMTIAGDGVLQII
jgi:hypothetical protein